MTEVDEAISQIARIRAQLAVSTRFQGFAPEVLFAGAVLSLLAMLAQMAWPELIGAEGVGYVKFWGTFMAGFAALVAVEAVPRSRHAHGAAAETMMATSLRLIAPFAAAQVVITLAICRFAQESLWLVPGLWQIVTALVGFCGVPQLPRTIWWAALWYFVSGTVVLIVAGSSHVLAPWMMGVPFAVGHAIIGFILVRAKSEGHARA